MCFDKGIFLNNRTIKDGYIEVEQMVSQLSLTKWTDLKLAVKWLKCKYNFGIEEITDFLGISTKMVEEAFAELPCVSCRTQKCRKADEKVKQAAIELHREHGQQERRRSRAAAK